MLKRHLHHLSISRPQTLLTSLSVIMFEDTHTHTACIGTLAFSFNLYFFGYQIRLSVFQWELCLTRIGA